MIHIVSVMVKSGLWGGQFNSVAKVCQLFDAGQEVWTGNTYGSLMRITRRAAESMRAEKLQTRKTMT